jgi:hypothetical protein
VHPNQTVLRLKRHSTIAGGDLTSASVRPFRADGREIPTGAEGPIRRFRDQMRASSPPR